MQGTEPRLVTDGAAAGASRRQLRMSAPWALFVTAIIVQVAFVVLLPSPARKNDSVDFVQFYDPVARNLLAGQGLVLGRGEFGSTYPPGFPIFLAGAYYIADLLHVTHVAMVLALNVVLMSLAGVLVFATARLFFEREIALFAAILWSTYLFNLWLIKQPNSEVPFIPLLYGGVYCLIDAWQKQRLRSAVACGVLGALGALVRPIAIALPVVLAVFLLTRREIAMRKRTMLAAFVLIAFTVTVLPWEADLYLHTGHFPLLSTNGPATILDGLTFTRRSNVQGIPRGVAELMHRITADQRQLDSSGQIARYLAREAKQHPGAVAELLLLKGARSWFGTDSGSHEKLILLVQCFYLALALAGFRKLYRNRPKNRSCLALFLVLGFYFWAMAVVGLSILRYLVPVMAYLLIPAAAVPAARMGKLLSIYRGESIPDFLI